MTVVKLHITFIRNGLRGVAVALLAFALLTMAAPVRAASIISVTNATGENDTDSDGCSLTEAIINANNDDQSGSTDCATGTAGADTISLGVNVTFDAAAGAFTGDTGGATAAPSITSDITILNGVGNTIARNINMGAFRLFHVHPIGALTLTSVTVTDGQISAPNGGAGSNGTTGGFGITGFNARGGAIFNEGTLTLSNAIVQNSAAYAGYGGAGGNGSAGAGGMGGMGGEAKGGGIYNTGTLNVNNSQINANTAYGGAAGVGGDGTGGDGGAGGQGGAARGGGVYTISGAAIFSTSSSLAFNTAQGGNGGGGGTAISASFFGGNGGSGGAANGGGLYHDSAGTISVTDTTFNANTSTSGNGSAGGAAADLGGAYGLGGGGGVGEGGGLYTVGTISQLTRTLFSANTANGGHGNNGRNGGNAANGKGGGLRVGSPTSSGISNVTITGNTARGGSGGSKTHVPGTDGGDGTGQGGGLHNTATHTLDSLTIRNNATFSDYSNTNVAGEGDGIYQASGTLTVTNSIVALNVSPADCAGGGTLTSGDYNIESDVSCGFTQTNDLQNKGSAELDMLGLALYGGQTASYGLQSTSEARNSGSTALTEDQRGMARPQGASDDRGAHERSVPGVQLSDTTYDFGDQILPLTSATKQFSVTNNGDGPLTITSVTLTTGTQFAIDSQTCTGDSPMAYSSVCTIDVTFTPTTAGAKADTLNVNSDADSAPDTISLSGNGVTGPYVSLSATSHDFGNQEVGTTSLTETFTVTNTGSADLNVSNVALDNTTDFTLLAEDCTTAGAIASGGGTCTIDVFFFPASAGAKTNTVTITSDAGDLTDTVDLAGVGIVSAVERLTNGGMETDANVDKIPDNWKKSTSINTNNDKQDCVTLAHGGSCSFTIKGNGTSKKLTQSKSFSVALAKGTPFTFSVWVQTSGVPGSGPFAQVKLTYTDLTTKVVKLTIPAGTLGWTPYTVSFTGSASKKIKKVTVTLLYNKGSGFIWFDDVSLTTP